MLPIVICSFKLLIELLIELLKHPDITECFSFTYYLIFFAPRLLFYLISEICEQL